MTVTLLTPAVRGKARQSGATLWRKQLLPVGEISYKGRKIAFTKEYLAGLVRAFDDKAYDAVPLQFADEANRHTEKPEHRRGTVRGLELTEDGLDAIVSVSPKAAEYLAEYPDLGISAKIVEDYGRADGKFYAAALKHVLGTLDPRVTGMRQWQAIEAANEDGEVIDLTAEQYSAPGQAPQPPEQQPPAEPGKPATEEQPMALSEVQEARLARLLDLPDDQFEAIVAAGGEAAVTGDGEELSDEELQALIDSLPDEGDTTGGEAAAAGGTTAATAATAGELAPVGLTAEAQAAIDLANSRAEETSLELARVTTALNRAAYERERDHYSREYGIPPRITDLARPVLEGEGHVVDLANGSSVDAGAIVRKVLKEIGQTVRMLDLSGELGTPLDFSADAEREAEEKADADRRELVKAYRAQTGI